MVKYEKTDKEILRDTIKVLEYLEAKDEIYCLSKSNPSINQTYTLVSFKVNDTTGKLTL